MIALKNLLNHAVQADCLIKFFLSDRTIAYSIEIKYFRFFVSRIEVQPNYLWA